ncbi:MurR/RpiR family transcriptional regulator [Hoeflea prorocentri]|uniref:MurR/RpiR family transcriptional regulator n=1 Tax=Hoeflea prorocentri TaxID=1922333 RepID=A0A9X3UK98_9HYPH|nr:MurR/RpiR family transcriptional regulator [Hoeflea prorocentri]MCY6380406.1 MurR/RpiR family transcriptional regulator [Hoeflea prorocentri]MDA5398206.1 MurR/RpiR family transcriptional regulator [Hoeflea prorocentri]
MSIRNQIEATSASFTRSERKLATALLSDYPYAGLISIQELAERAEVSPPSISRFVSKIGLGGYADMQKRLLAELRDGQRSPVDLHATSKQIEGGYLTGFLDRAADQMNSASEAVTEGQFNRICDLLNDRKRRIYVVGGRISDTIALILSFHLRQSREDVFHLPREPDVWPEYLLRMKPGDILFLVDFRRYQRNLVRLAEQANARRAKVVLMTDKGLSPATRFASEVVAVPIDMGTVWDSYSTALAVTEAIVTRIAEETWGETRARIEAWDAARETILENEP